jgi:hypothetical protein
MMAQKPVRSHAAVKAGEVHGKFFKLHELEASELDFSLAARSKRTSDRGLWTIQQVVSSYGSGRSY